MAKKRLSNISFRIRIDWNEEEPRWIKNSCRVSFNDNLNIDPILSLQHTVKDNISLMKDELNKFCDNAIEDVKVDSIYDGSIIALFTVIWDAAKTAKDAYDIVKMVTEVSELFMRGKLKEKYGYRFAVDTHPINKSEKNNRNVDNQISYPIVKRDAFFYYLLIANIAQAIIIGTLVFGAVTKLYF